MDVRTQFALKYGNRRIEDRKIKLECVRGRREFWAVTMVPELSDVADVLNITEGPFCFRSNSSRRSLLPPPHPGKTNTWLEKHISRLRREI